VRQLLIMILSAYRRWVSPMFGPHCRFEPSCSAYAIGAVSTYGAAHGSWLVVRRLARCQPFFAGGYDPVPTQPQGAHR
jgi:hypothetical protein